ncbi:MAG: cysteine hydrolase family protein [Ktedonobacteraceae bacterium]
MSTADTALVIIDVQVGLMKEAYRRDEVLDTIQQLSEQARGSGIPVVYVQHDGPKGDELEAGKPTWYIHPAIAPHEGEVVVHKRASDAFHVTRLQEELAARGIKHLIVMGGQTDWCVNATVCRAIYVGYDVTLVSDAHTTYDCETLTAPQVIAFYNELLDGYTVDGHTICVKPSSEIHFTAA